MLEVVFEGILRSKVYMLLMKLLSNSGKIIEVHCSEKIKVFDNNSISEQKIGSFLNLPDSASLLIKLSYIEIDSIVISSVLLRLVKYGDQFDIDFNFDERDVRNMSTTVLMKKIHQYVVDLGKRHEVNHWFGGMEPASDEDTRYFTDNKLGPLG